jgi:glycosyltransferase involved in cell wall biosynthesis
VLFRADTFPSLTTPNSPLTAKIRVGFCLDSFEIGGTELNAVRTAERLDRTRFELTALCLRDTGPLRQRVVAAGIPIERFPIRSLHGWSTAREGLRLIRWARRSADILHAHDIFSNIFLGVWGRLAARPAVLLSKRWWQEETGLPVKLANRAAYKLADLVLVNSPAVARRLQETDHVRPGRIRVVPNFLDDEAFCPLPDAVAEPLRNSLQLTNDNIVVGSVANLHALKDHATLLRACAKLMPRWPALTVVIIGDGPQREALAALAGTLGISDKVRLAGRLAPTPGLHRLLDISTLTSLHEGFPNSIIEAMAAGRPVIATAVGGVVDAVRHGETGFLVPAGDAVALASAMESLLANPNLRKRMGAVGAARARAEFAADRVIPRLEATYEELAEVSRRRSS